MTQPDFKSLELKIRRGKTLEQAAAEAGIDIAAATSYLEARREAAGKVGDDCLELNAAEAIHFGMKTLIAATKEKNRQVGERDSTEAGGSWSKTDAVIDIDAAKALLSFALNAKKLVLAKKGKVALPAGDAAPDLFDVGDGGETRELGNWVFKRIK